MNALQLAPVLDAYSLATEVAWKSSLLLIVATTLHLVLGKRWPLIVSVGWNASLVALLILPFATLLPPMQLDYVANSKQLSDPPMEPADPTRHLLAGDSSKDSSLKIASEPPTPVATIVQSQVPPPVSNSAPPRVSSGQLVALIYLCGVCLMGMRLVFSVYKLRRLIRRSEVVDTPQWEAALQNRKAELGIRRPVQICNSSVAKIPFTCGFWRPKIVLPSELFQNATRAEVEVIVLHELTHIARFDSVWHWSLRCLQVLYWWQPLLWLADRQMNQVRERVCDQFCVGKIGSRQQYADVLLRVVESIARPVELGVGLAMVRVPRISKRLHELASGSGLKRCRPRGIVSAMMLFGIVLGSGILGIGIEDIVAQTPAIAEEDPGDSAGTDQPQHSNHKENGVAESLERSEEEQEALLAIQKLVGQNFTVNGKGAVVRGVLGGFELTEEGFEHLGQLKNLQTLYLHKTNISDTRLEPLKGLTNLQQLYLGTTNVGDDGIEHLEGMTKLEYLHLGSTKVTDVGLKHLEGLPNLRILDLFDTQVTDAGLEHLQGLNNLQRLSLANTNVTDEGVRKLQRALPKLVIVGKPKWAVVNPDDAKTLSVSIAVPKRQSERAIDLRQPGSHFNVVITNKTDGDLRLWETLNSWGYFNLSFDVLDDDGKVVGSISKKPRGWTVNGPTWLTLEPGGHFTLEIDFDPEIWIWRTDVGGNKPAFIPFLAMANTTPEFDSKLRAVFRILPDVKSIEHNIWTGTVRSTPDNFVIRHTPRTANNDSTTSVRDPQLTDAEAIEIASRALLKKYTAFFEKCKPYHAKLAKGIWHVYGTVPGGGPGGTPEAHVRDTDGVVVRAFLSQ